MCDENYQVLKKINMKVGHMPMTVYVEFSLSAKLKTYLSNDSLHLDGRELFHDGINNDDIEFFISETGLENNNKLYGEKLDFEWIHESNERSGFIIDNKLNISDRLRIKFKLSEKEIVSNQDKQKYLMQKIDIASCMFRISPISFIDMVCKYIDIDKLSAWIERKKPYGFIKTLDLLPIEPIRLAIGKDNGEKLLFKYLNNDVVRDLIEFKVYKEDRMIN